MTELAKLAVQVDTGDVRRASGDLAAMQKGTIAVTAALAAATVATIAYTKRGLQNIDALSKQSRQLSGSIIGFRGYTQAAEDAGVSTAAAASAAEMLNVRIGEALRNNASSAAKALNRIGVSAEELANSDVDERMAMLADAMHDMPAAQVADELRQLGIRQSEITRLMMGGGEAIRAATREMKDYGLEISAVDAANIERTNDALARIGLITERLSNQLAIALAPALETVAILIGDAAKESDGFSGELQSAVDIGVRGFAFVADAIDGVDRSFQIAGRAIAVGVLAMEASVLGLALAIIDGPTAAVNGLINQLNRLPKVDISNVAHDLAPSLRARVKQAHMAVEMGMADINDVLMRPQPSAKILDTYNGIIAASKEAADTEIEQRARVFQNSGNIEAMAEAESARLDARAETLQAIENLERSFFTEQEQLAGEYLQQQYMIAAALGDGVIATEQANALKLESDKNYEEERRRLKLMAMAGELQMAGALAGNLAAIAQEGGKESFEAYKRFAQAQAGLNAAAAVLNVLASPITAQNPILGASMATSYGALAAVQVAKIEQQQYTARELGGQVKAGGSYLVGESGPELLTMGSDGHITSNKNMQEGGGQTIVMQISTGVAETVRSEINSLMPQIMRTMSQMQRARR